MCKTCGSSKVKKSQNFPLPQFAPSLKQTREDSKVAITSKSRVQLDLPEGNIQLFPGNVVIIESSLANDLIEKGAPIWVLSKR